MKIRNRYEVKHLPLSIVIVSVALGLTGCGGKGGDRIDDSPSASRSVTPVGGYKDWESALVPCKAAQIATEEQPLSAYVERLHQLADEKHEVCAQFGLGTLYWQGYDGINANIEFSHTYLRLAADAGVEDAARLLENSSQD